MFGKRQNKEQKLYAKPLPKLVLITGGITQPIFIYGPFSTSYAATEYADKHDILHYSVHAMIQPTEGEKA